jgi:predicted DNA-binding transcriptional regulator
MTQALYHPLGTLLLEALANDSAIGWGIFLGSIAGIVVYGLLLAYAWETTIRVTAFLAVALLLGILAWIGYTMATTPPPEPIAEIPNISAEPKPATSESKTETKS